MINSFISSIGVNIKIQFRNGFYYATLLMLLISILILQYIDLNLKIAFVPLMIIMNIISSTGFFLAILVLLERQELSYYALITSPIANNTYLFSKITAISVLALFEGLVLYIFSVQNYSDFFFVVLSIVCLAVIYCLACYSVALRYSNFNELLFPLVAIMMVLSGNLFFQIFNIDNPILIMFPSYGSFQLLSKGISATLTTIDIVIYIAQALLWIFGLEFLKDIFKIWRFKNDQSTI